MNEDNILKEIYKVEKLLYKSKMEMFSNPIDINNDNWINIAKRQNDEFYKENKTYIESISKKIIKNVTIYNVDRREKLLKALRKTEYLKNNFSTNLYVKNSIEWFNEQILIFILTDLGVDTRDALLKINDLYNLSKKCDIDLKKIIKKYIGLANGENRHGMGSTKSILDDILAQTHDL